MGKKIVVFYSHGGHTKRLAEILAVKLNCEKIEIGLPKSRMGFIGFIRLIFDGIKKRIIPINIPSIKWDEYENIVIGSPIWGGTMASPIYSFIAQQLKNREKYAIFSTSGGRGIPIIASEVAKKLGKLPIANVNICNKDLKNPNLNELIQPFLNALS